MKRGKVEFPWGIKRGKVEFPWGIKRGKVEFPWGIKRGKVEAPWGRGLKTFPSRIRCWASGSGRNRITKLYRFPLPSNPPFCLTGGEVGRLGNNGSIRRAD
jgi:hypothetical protein